MDEYSEADVRLVVDVLPVDLDDGTTVVGWRSQVEGEHATPLWDSPEVLARAILAALAGAGRLLPEDTRPVAELPIGAVVVARADLDPETEQPTYRPDGARQVVFHRHPTSVLGGRLGFPWVTADLPGQRLATDAEVQCALDAGAVRVGPWVPVPEERDVEAEAVLPDIREAIRAELRAADALAGVPVPSPGPPAEPVEGAYRAANFDPAEATEYARTHPEPTQKGADQ